MSTRGIIRQRVRHNLGETTEGTWLDADINYYIEESCDEHSQRAFSSKVIRFASSVKYVQDYEFSLDFGELCSIRYFDEDGGDRELDYVTRAVLRDMGYRGTEIGRACCFYREQDSFGLFPIPEKKITFEHAFEGDCTDFVSILDREGIPTFFNNKFSLEIIADDEVVDRDGLDPACVYISQIGVYLRRKGRYYPGCIYISMQDIDGYLHESEAVAADSINTRPEWTIFDFTHNPLEINPNNEEWSLRLYGNGDYQDADPQEYGGSGIEIGVDENTNAYFQMHRLRNDIEVEYYRNKCDPLLHDDQKLEIPQRYHHTIVKMTTRRCYAKGNYNRAAAADWKAEADEDMKIARAQAIIPTLGQRLEIRRARPLLPNIQYQGDGHFRIRFGSFLA